MTALLNVLLEITVYSAVLYGAILLFQKVFHKHISAALNYAVWALLILRLMMPITVDGGFHFLVMPDAPKEAVQTEQAKSAAAGPAGQADHTLPNLQTARNTAPVTPIKNEAIKRVNNNSPRQPAAWRIEWQTALALLWAAGVLASLTFVAVCWRKLQKKIRRFGAAAPGYVLELVERCKKDMDVKADIQVSVQGWLKSPALSISLKPKLLLPEYMLQPSYALQLEFGIRHELMHYRRRDHLTNLLLMALRCLHWFNPVVHFAFRRMQTDMETACDAGIASRMENQERLCYIQTMIDLCGDGPMQYVLGMGMCRGRKAMEKRVRGIFMKKRTGSAARFTAAALAGVLLLACFTTACQPTPDRPAVVAKNDDRLASAVTATPAPQKSDNDTLYKRLGAPEHWQCSEEGENGKLKIAVDADVILPDTARLSVATAKLRNFTQADIDKVVQVILGKGLKFTETVQFTKEQLEQLILDAKKSIADQEAGKEDSRARVTYDQNDLQYYQSLLKDAPSEKDLKEKDLTVETLKYGEGTYSGVSVNTMVNGQAYSVRAGNTLTPDAVRCISIETGSHGSDTAYSDFGGTDLDKPYGITLTKEQAAEQAEAIAAKLTDELSLCCVAPTATSKESTARNWGWACVFMREINGCPTAYTSEDVGQSMESEVQKPIRYEKMVIIIDDQGVTGFLWENPMTITGIENDNAKLMSFEQISKLGVKQLIKKYGKYGVVTKGTGTATVDVSRVELGLMRVAKKNSPEYYYLPVWNFFNEINESSYLKKPGVKSPPPEAEDQEDPGSFSTGYPQAWGAVTINALDGSVIDRDLGY